MACDKVEAMIWLTVICLHAKKGHVFPRGLVFDLGIVDQALIHTLNLEK
jgi:hypothetical protein